MATLAEFAELPSRADRHAMALAQATVAEGVSQDELLYFPYWLRSQR